MHYGSSYVYSGDIETGEYQLIKSYPGGSMRLSLTRDKKYVKFGDYLWNWQTKKLLSTLKLSERVQSIVLSIVNRFRRSNDPAFTIPASADNQYSLVLGEGYIRVIDLHTGELKLQIIPEQQ
jgi:hypothetical protein